ncbi:acyltransferase family protein [Pseudomonadota bacterium]
MKKIYNIQALRGVAVLSVVLFHLMTIEQKYGGTKTILTNIFNFGMFGVDLFFVISGFVMVAVTRGKFQDTQQAIRFLYHRASRIYPTYWFYSILVLGVFLINPSLVNSSQNNQVDILASFLLLPSEILPLVMVGWTLIHEMYFYLVFFLVLLITPEKHFVKAMMLWGAVVICMNLVFEIASPFAKLVFHPLTIEFILGCFIAILFYRNDNQIQKSRLLLIIVIIGLIASTFGYSLYQDSTGDADPQDWWRILIFGMPAVLIVFCFINAERNGFVIHSSLIKIGDASYSIYLSHVLTLSAAGRIWSAFASDSLYDNYIMIPTLFVLVIIVGILSYRYIEKPLLRYSRKIA